MKRVLAVLLAAVMLITIIPMSVFAENGPMTTPVDTGFGEEYLAWVVGTEPNAQGQFYDEFGNPVASVYDFYKNLTVNNDVYPGITYSLATNTLRIANVNAPKMTISANVMGDDFKIEVVGTCALGYIEIWGDGYGGNLTFTGTGTLTINKAFGKDNAIFMHAEGTDGKVVFGKSVKVNLYAKECAISTTDSTIKDASKVYVFENGQTSAEIQKYNLSYDRFKSINGVYKYNPDATEYAGNLLDCKDDPTGIYALTEGTHGGSSQTCYWVTKYIALPQFNSYVCDFNYFSGNINYDGYASLEFTPEQWEAQTQFTLRTVPSEEPAQIHFYEPNQLDSDTYYSETQLRRASDPNGFYGFNRFTISENGVVTNEGINIHRFVYAPGTKKFIKDESFAEISFYLDEWDTNEWSVVPGTEPVRLEYKGNCNLLWSDVYKDTNGTQYAKDWNGQVYAFTEGSGVMIGGEFYNYLTPVNGVNIDSLTRVQETVSVKDRFNYALNATTFSYMGDNQVAHQHKYNKKVFKSGAYTLGYTLYECACGKYYLANYTAPVGKVTGFACKARTATAQTLVWKKIAASSVAGYQVQISNAAGTAWGKAVATGANAITLKGLTSGANYKFRIRFFVKGADGKNYFSPWTALASPTLPQATVITKVVGAKNAMSVQWKKTAGVGGYQIQYAKNAKFSGAKAITVKGAAKYAQAIKGLAAGNYYVRVRTFKAIGGKYYFSTWSPAKPVKVR